MATTVTKTPATLVKGNITATPNANVTAAQVAGAVAQGFSNAPNTGNTGGGTRTATSDAKRAQDLANTQIENAGGSLDTKGTTPNPNTVVASTTPGTTTPTTPVNPYMTSSTADNPNAFGPNMTPSPSAQAHDAMTKSGTPAPQEPGAGSAAVSTALKNVPTTPDTTAVDTALASDPMWKQFLADSAKKDSILEQQTQFDKSLQQQLKGAGIPAMDAELMSEKNIINGTEDDIRNEITASGGFATNSQVLALSNARNQTLTKQYNALLDKRNQAYTDVTNMMNVKKDQQALALQQINDKLGIDEKMQAFADKFQSNAKEGFNTIISAVGISGLYNGLMNTDPSGRTVAQVEKLYGWQPGQLQQAASQDLKTRNADLSLKSKQLEIANKELELQKKQNPTNNFAMPGEADKSKVFSAIAKQDKNTQASIDMDKLATDPAYFYAVKAQLGL